MKTIQEFKVAEQKQYAKRLKQHVEETKLAYKAWTMLRKGMEVYKHDTSPMRFGWLKYEIVRLDPKHYTATCILTESNLTRLMDPIERKQTYVIDVLDLSVMVDKRIRSLRKLAKADKTMNIQYNGQDIIVLTNLSNRQ